MEEEAADDANAGGEDYAGDGGEEALLPGGGGDEEGGVHEVAEGEDAEEEGERSAEIEKHGVASGRGEAPEEISIARCVARGSYKAKGAAPAFFVSETRSGDRRGIPHFADFFRNDIFWLRQAVMVGFLVKIWRGWECVAGISFFGVGGGGGVGLCGVSAGDGADTAGGGDGCFGGKDFWID